MSIIPVIRKEYIQDGKLMIGKSVEKKPEVPIWQKTMLTLEEAASLTGIGINKLRELSNEETCNFVLWNGSKRLLKRVKLEAYLESSYSI